MQRQGLLVELLLGSSILLALFLMQVSAARGGDMYGSYLIKSRHISKLAEGLEIVDQFMPKRISSETKCKKYGLVLWGYYKDLSMDQFKLAKMIQEQNYDTNAFKRITMDTLRDLYINAIDQLIQTDLGGPTMELVNCLRDIFYNRDARARSYLNRNQLKRTVEQYSSIRTQNINFILDDEAKHPSLIWDQLEQPVQVAVVKMFFGDEERARAHFTPQTQIPEQVVIDVAAPVVVEQKQVVQEMEKKVEEQVKPVVEANTAEQLAKTLMSGFYADSERLTKQLPDEHRKLMEELNSWLHLLHHSLPIGARLSDRCEAYSKLMGAEPSQLGMGLLEHIFKQTSDSVSANQGSPQSADRRFLPDPNMRENFLFTIAVYPSKSVGDGLWVNLVDCVSLWKDDDERVRDFMRNSKQFLYSHLDPFIHPHAPAPGSAPLSPATNNHN